MLSGQDRKDFEEMLRLGYKYAESINVRGEPFPEEALIMTLLFKQHLMIKELKRTLDRLRKEGKEA
jgi:hypothetical protein